MTAVLNLSELETTAADEVSIRAGEQGAPYAVVSYNIEEDRERTRGDLARALLTILGVIVGGVIFFVAIGRIGGEVLAQSIFPPLIALAGTALGFYFGANPDRGTPPRPGGNQGGNATPTPTPTPTPTRTPGQ